MSAVRIVIGRKISNYRKTAVCKCHTSPPPPLPIRYPISAIFQRPKYIWTGQIPVPIWSRSLASLLAAEREGNSQSLGSSQNLI